VLRIVVTTGQAQDAEVSRGATNANGFHLAQFIVPETGSPDVSIQVTATSPLGEAQATIPVVVREAFAAATVPAAPPRERPSLVVSELGGLYEGRMASFLILLRCEPPGRPLADVAVRALYPSGGAGAREIYQATTDSRGFHLAEFSIPRTESREGSVLIQAVCPLGTAEAVFQVLP
jgi:hypothetical protein